MGMGMGIDFENPMGMGMGMGMTFENGYEWGIAIPAPNPPHTHPYLDRIEFALNSSYTPIPTHDLFVEPINHTCFIFIVVHFYHHIVSLCQSYLQPSCQFVRVLGA